MRMRPTWRARIRWLRPQMITPCAGCGNPAGFWVTGPMLGRRPWCLACIDSGHGPDRARVRVVRFDP